MKNNQPYLTTLFEPRSVVIVDACIHAEAVARIVVQNILDSRFKGVAPLASENPIRLLRRINFV